MSDDARASFLPKSGAVTVRGGRTKDADGEQRSREDGDFSHLNLKLGDELNLELLGSMITDQSPGGTVATHLGTPMVQTVAAADFLTYAKHDLRRGVLRPPLCAVSVDSACIVGGWCVGVRLPWVAGCGLAAPLWLLCQRAAHARPCTHARRRH